MTAPAFGALTAELRRAEADGHVIEAVLPALIVQRGLDDADDPAAVLHYRLAHATAWPYRSNGLTPRLRPQLRRIAGLIPQAVGPMAPEYEQALLERERRIEERADQLVTRATRGHEPWLAQLGPEPAERRGRHAWLAAAGTIVAYRDRYGVTSDSPLGIEPVTTDAQAVDAGRAAHALRATTPLPSALAAWHDAVDSEPGHGIDL